MKVPESQPTDLSPKQIRAARALLAWSQQELAKKAGVAGSTVADFERGYRTPVPNNAEAMRTALENAGVRFLPGGAVIGPQLPALASHNTSGAPIRWVDATDLGQWADRRDGQATMPTLIAKLVRAGHGPSVEIRFLSDEGIQQPGWDGITRSDQASRYVPEGTTGWEIGTQKQAIAAKANEDFEKRSALLGEITPADATFIFVTPRHWPRHEQWAQEKRVRNVWHDVRAYDANDLVHWIELYPAVGQWLATLLGKRPPGVRQLEELWLEWSLATQIPLTLDLILADRDDDAIAVLQWLRSAAALLSLQAESAEEVAAFVYAAISQLPSNAAQHYLTRCLVATNADAARVLADSITPLIIVLLDPEPGLAGRLAQHGHHVLLAYGGNTDRRGDYRRLSRPSRGAIERALVDAGIPEPRAKGLARDSSRSLAILRRLIPASPGRLPKWAEERPARGLLAALMAGGWDEGNESDKHILAQLGNVSYAEIVADLASLASTMDGPLRKVGKVWKIASPQDAWSLLAHHLSPADIERFESVVLDVLGAHDPRYDVDPEERWMAATKGIRPEYSGYLRHGLGEVLILLSLFGDRAQSVPGAHRCVEFVVRNLLKEAPRERWWSLSRDFQLLAEAAPATFLDAIDESLLRDDKPILSLFGADGGPFGGEHISDLLWALETLAWAPQNLGRVSETLAKLDMLDPGGRFTNRPGNSLAKIFLLWLPQTYATLEERLRVLDYLRKTAPAAAWKLMLAVLPSGHGSVTPSPHPRWRDDSQDNVEIVTYGLLGKGTQEITTRLLQDVGLDPERWKKIFERIGHLAPNPAVAIKKLVEIEPQVAEEERPRFWEVLRGVLHHHRQFPEAGWSLKDDTLNEVEILYNKFEPTDPIVRIAWLFKQNVALPNPDVDGWKSNQTNISIARRHAIEELLKLQGVEGIFALARSVELAGYIGIALTELKVDAAIRDKILARALTSDNLQENDLGNGLVHSTFAQLKEAWARELLDRARREQWGTNAVLIILRALPITRWTWDQAHFAGRDIEDLYWKRVPVLWMEGNVEDIVFMANKLIESGRARPALHFVGFHLSKKLPSELLVRVLEQAIRQPREENGDDHNEPTMFQHYVAEILKALDEADVSDDEMLRLEWAYLPALEYSPRPAKVLIKALAERPAFFIEVLSALFKPSEESGVVEPPSDDPERARAVASRAFDLLRLWDRVPGTMPDGHIDGAVLESWVKEARKLAAAVGRADIADQKIGEALSASPMGADGNWPAEPVRDVIEITRSKHLETGFQIGLHNRRGVTTRLPSDGGAQERDLAALHHNFARAIALEWPRTSATLERIAQGYEDDARSHDEDAERSDWHG